MKIMENVKWTESTRSEGYEISIRREELSPDLYSFYYCDDQAEGSEEESMEELSAREQGALLKCLIGLFAAAVGTVVTLLLV